ncbi:MAG: hypothetical protein GWN58_34570, partial [Anaerolineae bacterium]|nr:hypothetical protein [Anaerolineae bacterium]
KGYVRLLGWGLYSNLADRDTILTYLSGPLREPDVVVFEEYRVRPDKALQHIGSTVPTIEEIGRIKLWCFERDIVYVAQTAGQAKHRWPSERIRLHFPELAMYPSSTKIYADILNKHQVDALRHLLTYLEVTQGCEFWAPGLQPI